MLRAPVESEADGAIRLRDVTVRYGRRTALEGVTGTFAAGSMTAVTGANGAGKSTLLAAIVGAVPLAAGNVERPPLSRLAFLPQLTAIDRDYPLTLAELIALGGWHEFGVFRAAHPSLRARVATAAAQVGLADRLGRVIGETSVGELQRALFARVILQDASVILLDEPFAAVDAPTVAALADQVERWHREGRTVVCVLHDLNLVRARFASTLVLANSVIAWGPTRSALRTLAA